MSYPAFSLGSPVYVRYKDHVLFKNIIQPIEEAMERETIGWLSKENSENKKENSKNLSYAPSSPG